MNDDSQPPTPPAPHEPPYGEMAHLMKDHLCILQRGHLFTTPCMAARLSLRFYVTIAVSASGAQIEVDPDGDAQSGPAMMFHPAQPRFVRARDAQLVAALVNPLHPEFPRFRHIPRKQAMLMLPGELFLPLREELARAYRGELDAMGAMHLHEKITACAASTLPPLEPLDPRVVTAATRARSEPLLSNEELAHDLGLSPSRLSHLFSSQMGLPLRAYLLWSKVNRTAMLFAQGIRLTEVTHMAGFADQAHMRRVFHDLFGASPSHFLRNENVVVRQLAP